MPSILSRTINDYRAANRCARSNLGARSTKWALQATGHPGPRGRTSTAGSPRAGTIHLPSRLRRPGPELGGQRDRRASGRHLSNRPYGNRHSRAAETVSFRKPLLGIRHQLVLIEIGQRRSGLPPPRLSRAILCTLQHKARTPRRHHRRQRRRFCDKKQSGRLAGICHISTWSLVFTNTRGRP